MAEDTTVDAVVMFGNSDNRLSQAAWSQLATETFDIVTGHALAVHGQWGSDTFTPWQNGAMSITLRASQLDQLRTGLRALAGEFGQDSIALLTGTTEFLSP